MKSYTRRAAPACLAGLILVGPPAWSAAQQVSFTPASAGAVAPTLATGCTPESPARSDGPTRQQPVGETPLPGFTGDDLYRLKSVGTVCVSPDGGQLSYSVGSGGYWLYGVAGGTHSQIDQPMSAPCWSPDSRWVAFLGRVGDRFGLVRRRLEESGLGPREFIAPVSGTNHPISERGESFAWSPDSTRIAYVSAVTGPEGNADDGDPQVITRYLYKPARGRSFASRRLTDTPGIEARPAWSPDGAAIAMLAATRPRTSSETRLEDDHVWVMKPDGMGRRDVGAAIDNRQTAFRWSGTGEWLYVSARDRGDLRLYRVPARGSGKPEAVEPVLPQHGRINSWSVSRTGLLAYAMTTPDNPGELYLRTPAAASSRRIPTLNDEFLATRRGAETDRFTFKAEDGLEVEAFLTKPLAVDPAKKHPMIVFCHGGPHSRMAPISSSRPRPMPPRVGPRSW